MQIRLSEHVAINLEAISVQTGRLEFSGLGTCYRDGDDIVIDDVALMNVGSEGYTEADPRAIYEYLQRVTAQGKQIKVWFHRHPVGNGVPGPHNWSGRDQQTILREPLGSFPHMVKWSVSIVRTPRGWVGRLDNYITNETHHMAVVGQGDPEVLDKADELLKQYYTSKDTFLFGNVKQWDKVKWDDTEDDVAYDIGDRLSQMLFRKYGAEGGRKVLKEIQLMPDWKIKQGGVTLLGEKRMPPKPPTQEEIDRIIKENAWFDYTNILLDDALYEAI